jgi:predicted aspartyl protease
MSDTLQEFLLNKGYTKIKLHATRTNHFEIKVVLNRCKGTFIVDTGASNSCIGLDAVDKFNLSLEKSDVKAAGAGASNMATQLSKKNTIKIGSWKWDKLPLVVFDLSHVNTALTSHNSNPVDGIIGADILKKGQAIIDYNKKYMYLKI